MTLTTYRFLREHRDKILSAWKTLVETEPRAVKLQDAILMNHLPELLDELAAWMEHDVPPGTEPMRLAAVAHAAQRVDRGFKLTQLIHEVRLLRLTILRLLLADEAAQQSAEKSQGMAERVLELARLNSALDWLITDAVHYFVEERERRLQDMANREIAVLRESDQRKSDFLGILSHELRNPLAPILNGLEILDRATPGSQQAAWARAVIHRQTKHLTRLVDDLLDTTRLSHGKVVLHRRLFDLIDVVRNTIDDHRTVFDQRGLTLSLEVFAGPVWIDGDPTRVAQILSNLLHNAAKFTGEGGSVTVTIAAHEGRASLRVCDDGIGMDQNVMNRIFEPFVQAQQNSARVQGGLGLGLTLVKGLAELHGGSVSARSEGRGSGSEFIVALPLASGPVAIAAGTAPAAAPRVVLIIEDNVDASDTLAELLVLSGHSAHVARDGASGLALAHDLKPDVVLCDVGLPDIDGYEVARALRADSALASTRLIALTGYAQPEDRQRGEQAGFQGYLAKPTSLDELNDILR